MWMHELPIAADAPGERKARAFAATLLRTASRALDGLAVRLTFVERPAATEPVLEYHADAGAPEGALYVDGRLVGHVLGVSRL